MDWYVLSNYSGKDSWPIETIKSFNLSPINRATYDYLTVFAVAFPLSLEPGAYLQLQIYDVTSEEYIYSLGRTKFAMPVVGWDSVNTYMLPFYYKKNHTYRIDIMNYLKKDVSSSYNSNVQICALLPKP